MYILYLKLPKDLVIIVQLEDFLRKFSGSTGNSKNSA